MARPESEIFNDIGLLCETPGYAHVIAYYCYKDNTISYGEKLLPEDLEGLYSWERLIRTELSTLIGLMAKAEIKYETLEPKNFQSLIESTDTLMKELHQALIEPHVADIGLIGKAAEAETVFMSGACLREAIFYSAESAYNFQYRDFSIDKYSADEEWLKKEKGFAIADAVKVANAISEIQNAKVIAQIKSMDPKNPDTMTILPAYVFSVDEISNVCSVERTVITKVVDNFALGIFPANSTFKALNDYNETNARPILKYNETEYVLFQPYGLYEALYESPFYWMVSEASYKATALANRGRFTEECAATMLEKVFGECVYRNVNIVDKSGNNHGEIDVLIVFANRAIVLQAKSKKLTLEARKGNDLQIRDDFKKSVQNSYEQGYSCASALTTEEYKFILSDGAELTFAGIFKEIYILCVLSDHYPALSWQAREFLKYDTNSVIFEPFVLDIFTLDVMCEIISSPLYFLSYVNRHAMYVKRVMSSHEITILAYHIKSNLWLEEKTTMLALSDDISTDVDIAMLSRRAGLPGDSMPTGFLTKFVGTPVGDLLQSIEKRPDPATIDLGFALLMLSGKTISTINTYFHHVRKMSRLDAKPHDFSVSFSGSSSGITLHCNTLPVFEAKRMLHDHCIKRKYKEKAASWFGICIDPGSGDVRFGLELDFQWEFDGKLDAITANMKNGKGRFGRLRALLNRPKVGRNGLCPCGSGKKSKRCCYI